MPEVYHRSVKAIKTTLLWPLFQYTNKERTKWGDEAVVGFQLENDVIFMNV